MTLRRDYATLESQKVSSLEGREFDPRSMQHLYPNFYSLVSAPSQPLDPRIRRRSFVWSPVNVATDGGEMDYRLSTADSLSNSAVLSQPVRRRRSVSQAPIYSLPRPVTGIENGAGEGSGSPSMSGGSTPPPPPPAPFADETDACNTDRLKRFVNRGQSLPRGANAFGTTAPTSSIGHPSNISDPNRRGSMVFSSPISTLNQPINPYGRIVGSPTEDWSHLSNTGGRSTPLPAYGRPTSLPPAPRMQSAISLQCLDQLNRIPAGSGVTFVQHANQQQPPRLYRPKVMMGLRDLNNSGRLMHDIQSPPFPQINTVSSLPPLPLSSSTGRLANQYHLQAVPFNAMCPMSAAHYTGNVVSQPMGMIQANGRNRSRVVDRRRTLWGVPSPMTNAMQYAPLMQPVVSGMQPVFIYPNRDASSMSGFPSTPILQRQLLSRNTASPANGNEAGSKVYEEEKKEAVSQSVGLRRRKPVNTRRAQVVSAFEQSLNSMSQRLQQLTNTTAKKDSELHELRATIEALRSKSGLGTSNAKGSGRLQGASSTSNLSMEPTNAELHRTASGTATSVGSSPQKSIGSSGKKNSWFRNSIGKAFRKKTTGSTADLTTPDSPQHRESADEFHTLPPASPTQQVNRSAIAFNPSDPMMQQQYHQVPYLNGVSNGTCPSTPVLSAYNSNILSSTSRGLRNSMADVSMNISPQSGTMNGSLGSSGLVHQATPAIRRSAHTSISSSPTPNVINEHKRQAPHRLDQYQATNQIVLTSFHSATPRAGPADAQCLPSPEHGPAAHMIPSMQAELFRLQQQLNERETRLTDVQLEALSSTHQVNQLRDQITSLYSELQNVRCDNQRLHQMVKVNHTTVESENGTSNLTRIRNGHAPGVKISGENGTTKASSEEYVYDVLFAIKTHGSVDGGDRIEPNAERPSVISISSLTSNKGEEVSVQLYLGLIHMEVFDQWSSLDTHLKHLFHNYLTWIDPENHLELQMDEPRRINIYSLATAELRFTHILSDKHEVTQFEDVRAHFSDQPKDAMLGFEFEQSTTSISLHLLTARSLVQMYMDLLDRYRCAVFCSNDQFSLDGERGVCFLLAGWLKSTGRVKHMREIAVSDDESQTARVAQTFHDMVRDAQTTKRDPIVIVLSQSYRLSHQFFIDLFDRLGLDSKLCASIGSIQAVVPLNGSMNRVSQLPGRCCWIQSGCTNHVEAKAHVSCMLRRQLVERVVQHCSVGDTSHPVNSTKWKTMVQFIDWLEQVWERINQFEESIDVGKTQASSFSSLLLHDFPIFNEVNWFLDCLSRRIVPLIHHPSRTSTGTSASAKSQLIDWLISTWPWTVGKNQTDELRSQLLSLFHASE